MDVFESLTPCFGTCMMSLALMALILLGVVAYIEWCNEYERVQALKAEEEVKRVEELFDRAISLQSEVDTLIRKKDCLGE